MNNPQTLTKENFFNALFALYPEGLQIFCNWIDEYKASVDWGNIFGGNFSNDGGEPASAYAPKYHELPYAMQLGIFLEFIRQRQDTLMAIDLRDLGDLGTIITSFVRDVLQPEATNKN